jgi:mannose-6-phosphate isomerase
MKIEKKPYKLIGKFQHYDWGTKNEDAFIPELLGIDYELDLPYAEYWIGIHPNAPSEIMIDNQKYFINEVIDKFPAEILGKRVEQKFDNKLPFLLKLLSISKALSIQAHPNKKLAEELYKIDPQNYPDSNHKPEIAIAVDSLDAIVGLKDLAKIKIVLEDYPELFSLLDNELITKIQTNSYRYKEEIIIELYSQIMNAPFEKLERCILDLVEKFKSKENLFKPEKQFLTEYNNYGIDVGLISILLYNYVELKEGDAIFTEAGIPHAYLKGNIIECMANSDNVVRAGLTPKFKDVKTLTKMIKVRSDDTLVKKIETEDKIIYKTAAEEFELSQLKLNSALRISNNDEMNILFVLDGQIIIEWEGNEEIVHQGEFYLIPAILNNYIISAISSSKVYCVTVPK